MMWLIGLLVDPVTVNITMEHLISHQDQFIVLFVNFYAPKNVSKRVKREGFNDWRNTIVTDNHEKSTTHRDYTFRGTEERLGSLQNRNILVLLELISQFDSFLARHISKYENVGKGNPSCTSKTTCEELIQIMAQKVHAFIVDEPKFSSYFSLLVHSTPDL